MLIGEKQHDLCGIPSRGLDICNACHPFFTGKQKLMDTEGRVDRFLQKYGMATSE